MSDIKVNHTQENDVHVYRRGLEKFEQRTGLSPNQVDTRGTGEEREMFARMDEALSVAELRTQNAALEARLAKLEREPVLEARAIRPDQTDGESARWLRAIASGDNVQLRTMGTATISASGSQLAVTNSNNTPTDMERRIRERMQQASIMRQLGVVSTIDSKRTLLVEGSTLPTAALVTEHFTISPGDPTIDTVSVVPYKFVSATRLTQEFIEDAIGQSGIGSALDYVANKIGVALGREMEKHYQRGTGSSQPQGIFSWDSTNSVYDPFTSSPTQDLGAGGAGNSFADDATVDILLDTLHTVSPQYRASPRFAWVLGDQTLKVIRKLKDGNGQFVWSGAQTPTQTLVPAAPGTILGHNYYIGEWMPIPTTSTNAKAILACGDFNYFEIFDRTGMTTVVDPYSAASAMATTIYVYARTDSRITLPAAFATLTV